MDAPHLYLLKQVATSPQLEDVEITLLCADRHTVDPRLFPSFAEGFYSPEELLIDIEQWVKKADIKWRRANALSLDILNKRLLTDQGHQIPFDIISFATGSFPQRSKEPTILQHALRLRTNKTALETIQKAKETQHLVIVGDGIEAIEMTLAIHAWRRKNNPNGQLHYISPAPLLTDYPKPLSQRLKRIMHQKDISLTVNASVQDISNASITTTSGEHSFTDLLWMTQPEASTLFEQAGLPTNKRGCLLVENTLQVKSHPFIFAAGSCMAIAAQPEDTLHFSFLDSMQQAIILWENIKGYVSNGEGYFYSRKKGQAVVLSVGYRKGLFLFHNRALVNRWAWRLKMRQERQWLGHYA
ncbi:NAD(P)/FAD-dependent oxidoreductase [Pullulanibacillus camelliae]|nr:FAD-dependent oxidoreductase [Pullulanibacillus camelliae]